MLKQPRCRDEITNRLNSRLADLRKLMDSPPDDGGRLEDYGLCFDYVAGEGRKLGYFRYQLSCGGPSDEFRFYVDCEMRPYRVEYWFMDWWDGACRRFRSGLRFRFLVDSVWDALTVEDNTLLQDLITQSTD